MTKQLSNVSVILLVRKYNLLFEDWKLIQECQQDSPANSTARKEFDRMEKVVLQQISATVQRISSLTDDFDAVLDLVYRLRANGNRL